MPLNGNRSVSMMNARILGSLLLLCLVVSCRGAERLPSASSQTPVVIISIDTLRSDHLPAYGYTGVATPHIDRFRQDAVLYERAYSQYPLTLPSHTCLLTGLLPADNGIRDNIGYKLKPSVRTLAEDLKAKGYTTGASVSAFVLRHQTGLDRGFDFYDDDAERIGKSQSLGNIQRPGKETVAAATKWIDRQSGPFFFFLHLYEPHTPYEPPEPFLSRYENKYDGEIATADAIVGEFLDHLRAKGLYDRAMIILLSDHGEGLGEHQEEEHGLFLYRQTLQVPLMVKLPGGKFAGQSVASPVQLIDVMPTVLDRTTGELDGYHLPGQSLLSFLGPSPASPRPVYSETYYPKLHFGWSDLHSLIRGNDHYIRAPSPELYDLAADPEESRNVLEDNRRTYFAMKNDIEPFVKEAEAPAAVDPEDAAKLAALGYLGSTVKTEPGAALPDPKDKVAVFQEIKKAFADFQARKMDEALELSNQLLAENPRMVDLWSLKSKTLRAMGREDEAIEASREALKLFPEMPNLIIELADVYVDAGKLDDAYEHAELALKADPAGAHEVLARVWIARKDYDQAEREAQLALDADGDRVKSMMTLAQVKKEKGKLEEALALLDQAVVAKKKQEALGLHFLRGDVLARLGRFDEAEKEFREEIRIYPYEAQSYKNLLLLLSGEGRLDEATKLIYELIDEAPTPPSFIAVSEALHVIGDTRGSLYWARKGLQKFPKNATLRDLSVGKVRPDIGAGA